MRTSRVSVAGTVVLAILGGLSVTVVAQPAQDAERDASHMMWDFFAPHALPEG